MSETMYNRHKSSVCISMKERCMSQVSFLHPQSCLFLGQTSCGIDESLRCVFCSSNGVACGEVAKESGNQKPSDGVPSQSGELF
jgi:hypothetical protein